MAAARTYKAEEYFMRYRLAMLPLLDPKEAPKMAAGVHKDILQMTQGIQVAGPYTPDMDKLDRKALQALKKNMRR